MRDFDRTFSAAVFFTAMVMLGVGGAVILLRHQAVASHDAGVAATNHHVLVSPYAARPFLRGQPVIQTNRAAGQGLPRDLARAYQRLGYSWISIADINTTVPVASYNTEGMVEMVSDQASYGFGRFFAFGADHHEDAATPQAAIDWIHRSAAVAYLAQPSEPPNLTYDQVAALRGLDGLEFYDAQLATQEPALADATALWDQLLTAGHHVWGLVADNTVAAIPPRAVIGATSVDVQVAAANPLLIADALKNGAFVSSTGVRVLGVASDSGQVTVVTSDATRIDFYGAGGRLLATTRGSQGVYRVHWDEKYIRAVATRDRDGARAWTEPVFVIP